MRGADDPEAAGASGSGAEPRRAADHVDPARPAVSLVAPEVPQAHGSASPAEVDQAAPRPLLAALGRNRLLLIGLAAVAGAAALWAWWTYRAIHPETEDAFLQAHVVNISAEVGGRVTEVAVRENAFVRSGAVLFRIDPATLTAARESARAAVDLANQSVGATGQELPAAEAQLASAVAARSEAELVLERQKFLFARGDVTRAALDEAAARAEQAEAAVAAATAGVAQARARSGAPGADNAAIRAARAELVAAELALARTTVTAPADGWVSNLRLRPGQVVEPGQPLFALVEANRWWVEANFKETDLARIRPGQPASVTIDMYPGLSLAGQVESIGPASSAAFSLLPPENATGNWVKVTQRFPVRIRLEGASPDPGRPLRVGASATVTVDTSSLAD